ncbi:MAG: NnrS family protein [Proteobacteria bacterium]|jgi:uncharacterized protein involved in response to NO|nr:NnrS family protein [Pseudomonadota bacterium]MCG6935828.1 NnrS family protein [Pseudomonadota bacterium]
MQIEEAPRSIPGGWAPFALGFRPFFILAGLAAVGLMTVWVYALDDFVVAQTYFPGRTWHAHEMLFGYTVAVIAGFLLTAVKNWTDLPVPRGAALAGFALLWLLGRLAPFMAGLVPLWLVALTDMAFLPVLAMAVAWPILQRRQYSNIVFILILLLMACANGLMHLEALKPVGDTAWYGQSLMMFLILLLIVVMGGRVIPFFTERGVSGVKTRSWRVIEWLAGTSVVLLALAELLLDDGLVVWLALLAFTVHYIRLVGWYDRRIWREPLVWVLQLGYAWLVAALGLAVLAHLGLIPLVWAWHAFTVGGIGGITLGMMARVSLGHTGREMKLPQGMVSAFVLINLAAALRVIGPMLLPDDYPVWLIWAGVVWILAFLVFIGFYATMLLRPRVDGRPG